jgi:D-alanyl-D-alanine endopeptidase (penicillin-binding protein 7)
VHQNAAPTTLTNKSVQIYDTNTYNSQPSVNARAALVMDAKTGEVLFM